MCHGSIADKVFSAAGQDANLDTSDQYIALTLTTSFQLNQAQRVTKGFGLCIAYPGVTHTVFRAQDS